MKQTDLRAKKKQLLNRKKSFRAAKKLSPEKKKSP
jgi:hypothetical protein